MTYFLIESISPAMPSNSLIAEKSAPKSPVVEGCKAPILLDGCKTLPAVLLVGCKIVALDEGMSVVDGDGCNNDGLELDIVRGNEEVDMLLGNMLGTEVLVEDVGKRMLPEECDV